MVRGHDGDEIYEISSLTRTLLDTVKDSFAENHAKIVFMAEEDRFRSTSNQSVKQIYELAKKYGTTFDFIDVEFVNPDLHPEQVKKYLQHSENAKLESSDVVFEGPSGQYKIVSTNNFLTTDSESGKVIGFARREADHGHADVAGYPRMRSPILSPVTARIPKI